LTADIVFVVALIGAVAGAATWYFSGGPDRLAARYRRRRSKL
jgi:membrane protein DedA with SNARE-associated domain